MLANANAWPSEGSLRGEVGIGFGTKFGAEERDHPGSGLASVERHSNPPSPGFKDRIARLAPIQSVALLPPVYKVWCRILGRFCLLGGLRHIQCRAIR